MENVRYIKWICEIPICGRYERNFRIDGEMGAGDIWKLSFDMAVELSEELKHVPLRLNMELDQWYQGIRGSWEYISYEEYQKCR